MWPPRVNRTSRRERPWRLSTATDYFTKYIENSRFEISNVETIPISFYA